MNKIVIITNFLNISTALYIVNWFFLAMTKTNYKSKYLQRKELSLLKSNMGFGILLYKYVIKRKMYRINCVNA